ncbi:Fusaric acid resistance protein-like-domain-containing protein [Lipomyces japonicus]|uniref:Fusaric acid resistance protein-like-domain-containing protein n=1 Tax=Lipomyces japonicus TaxID=56871 RepID=UPI0034CF55B0
MSSSNMIPNSTTRLPVPPSPLSRLTHVSDNNYRYGNTFKRVPYGVQFSAGTGEPEVGSGSGLLVESNDRGYINGQQFKYEQFWTSSLNYFRSKSFTRPLKSSLTYVLASLTVFSSVISRSLGTGDGKHLAATITIYFHASRSIGSMIEATLLAELAVTYATILSFLSMQVSAFFDGLDLIEIGHAIVLVIFCACGFGSIAFMKQKIGRPTFNTATSLASVAYATILIHEGAVQEGEVTYKKLRQVFVTVNLGILIANAVCYLVFPYSGVASLKQSTNAIMKSYSNALSVIMDSFMEDVDISTTEMESWMLQIRSLVSSTDTQLHESKFEHFVTGTVKEYELQVRLTSAIQLVMQRLNGLKGSQVMKWRLGNASRSEQLHSPCSELFEVFIYYLEEDMNRLTAVLKKMFDGLPYDGATFKCGIRYNPLFKQELEIAMKSFKEARSKALKQMYGMDVLARRIRTDDDHVVVHLEEVASTCGQFSHGLLQVSGSVMHVLDVLQDYNEYLFAGRVRNWDWIKFWERWQSTSEAAAASGAGASGAAVYGLVHLDQVNISEAPRRLMNLFSDDIADIKFSKPLQSRMPSSLSFRIWRAARYVRRDDVKYGFKVGIGAMIFTLPAFVDYTRPMFQHYRAEWGLVSFLIVMNISIGGTVYSAVYRIIGTLIGTSIACLVWVMFPGQPVALAIVCFVISFPCFQIILNGKQNNVLGRFTLLTFNLTALYSYSLSMNDDDDGSDEDEGGTNPIVSEIAFHRVVSVICGVLWGIFITAYVWPNSARAELKLKLGLFWFRMGLIWKSDPVTTSTVSFLENDTQVLEKSLISMRLLVLHAENEIRMRGRFPKSEYESIINATQDILDAYQNIHSMAREQVQDPIIKYTTTERQTLTNRIFLLFYILASSLRLGLPLPDQLPNTDYARDLMIAKIKEFRLNFPTLDDNRRDNINGDDDDENASEEDFVLVYAYVLSSMAVNEGLLKIVSLLQNIYGVIDDEALMV